MLVDHNQLIQISELVSTQPVESSEKFDFLCKSCIILDAVILDGINKRFHTGQASFIWQIINAGGGG